MISFSFINPHNCRCVVVDFGLFWLKKSHFGCFFFVLCFLQAWVFSPYSKHRRVLINYRMFLSVISINCVVRRSYSVKTERKTSSLTTEGEKNAPRWSLRDTAVPALHPHTSWRGGRLEITSQPCYEQRETSSKQDWLLFVTSGVKWVFLFIYLFWGVCYKCSQACYWPPIGNWTFFPETQSCQAAHLTRMRIPVSSSK